MNSEVLKSIVRITHDEQRFSHQDWVTIQPKIIVVHFVYQIMPYFECVNLARVFSSNRELHLCRIFAVFPVSTSQLHVGPLDVQSIRNGLDAARS